MSTAKNFPTHIDAKPDTLEIVWSDGKTVLYQAPLLRSVCQCASCVSEITGEVLVDREKIIKQDIRLIHAEPQGNYAIALGFSDGHSTGIYTYEFLNEIRSHL